MSRKKSRKVRETRSSSSLKRSEPAAQPWLGPGGRGGSEHGGVPWLRLAENNLSVCGYFSAVFSSQYLSLSGQYFGAGLCGHIV